MIRILLGLLALASLIVVFVWLVFALSIIGLVILSVYLLGSTLGVLGSGVHFGSIFPVFTLLIAVSALFRALARSLFWK